MLKLKLEALGHPTPNDVVLSNRKEFASTVLWLEDQKIRLYTIEDRAMLRNLDDMKVWEEGYKKYCADLNMPSLETQIEQLTWMLGHAIRLEFLDDPGQYEAFNSEEWGKQDNKKKLTPAPKIQAIFDGKINVQDKDFISGVRALANKLNVPHHPNHLLQLEAVARIVHERLSPAAKNRKPITGTPFPFEKGNDIVSVNDPALDYPMRILRLLQIQSLRELQTQINETIVSVQDLTANPKTDTKLGKVGF
ncbi:RNA transcription, translation and transport factor protein [Scaptodrosophila lebanonensis]|uniref:RNA transcription, translation and transport factor protein n=1 Tax=Drosophila lebanonensis TaxID=7225 RepID=A0A6J2THF2_DROLE|nr:RNA transcription, translation and transport factor protein [Scaptodrosophila lebanonensis]